MTEALKEDFQDDSTPEQVERARALGWKSPKEWKGDPPPNGFQKASEYAERGETVLPLINSQLAKSNKELKEAKQAFEDFKKESLKTAERNERMYKLALNQQRKQITSEFEARKEAAIEVGDKETYRQINKEEKETLKTFDEEAKEKVEEKKDAKADLPKAVEDWVASNPWFNSDDELRAIAVARHGKLLKEKPGLTIEENLDLVLKHVKSKYPEAFGIEDDEEDKPSRGSRVEGGSRGGSGSGRSAWSKVGPDVKAAADKFIKNDGVYILKGETVEKNLQNARERYAEDYLKEFGE